MIYYRFAAVLLPNATWLPNAYLGVEDGLITSLSQTAPHEATVADLGQQYALPGLLDAHVHLHSGLTRNLDYQSAQSLIHTHALAMLRQGVTSVRDVGSPSNYLLMRDNLNETPTRSPTIRASGRPITITDGHAARMGYIADTPEQLMASIHQLKEEGADLVKIMATAGGSEGCQPHFSQEMLTQAVKIAHSLNLPVAAHAHSGEGMARCTAALVDTIDHASFKEAEHYVFREDIAKAMARQGTIAVFTPVAYRKADNSGNHAVMRQIENNWLRLYEFGVPIAIGTDVGVPHMLYHDSTVYAILALLRAGIPAQYVFGKAYDVTAKAIGLANIGRIQVGYKADLIAVAKNPFEHPETLYEVSWVLHQGKEIEVTYV